MWQKRVSRRRRIKASARKWSIGWIGFSLMLCSVPAIAQSSVLAEIPHTDKTLLQVSESALAKPITTPSGVELSVERKGELVRFTATHEGVLTRSNWYQTTRSKPWVVFETRSSKFFEVDNRVLVTLSNPEQLEVVADEIDAIKAKQYPGLGYSILWLQSDQDPIGTVKRLQADQRVERAELQLKRPQMFPL